MVRLPLALVCVCSLVLCAISSGAWAAKLSEAEALAEPPAGSVEVVAERDGDSQVFVAADGSRTAIVYSEPVFAEDDGDWVLPDPTLVASRDEGFAWENQAGVLDVDFALVPDGFGMVRVEAPGGELMTFGLAGANAAVTPVRDGAVLTYPGVLPDTDLVYEVVGDLLKELIVLHKVPAGPVTFRFPLGLVGLTAQLQTSGEVVLVGLDVSRFTKSGRVVMLGSF